MPALSIRVVFWAVLMATLLVLTPKRWIGLLLVIAMISQTIRILVPGVTETHFMWWTVVLIIMAGLARAIERRKRRT